MKKIGILSDTHSCWDERFAEYFKECDEVWHAGDIGCIDVLHKLSEVVPVVRAVYGNIDHDEVQRACKDIMVFETEGVKVLLTHIGGYPGRYARGMKQLLRDIQPTIMVCGHSHILKVMYDHELGVLHINPGAAGNQGWHRHRTLIRLTLKSATPQDLEVIELA